MDIKLAERIREIAHQYGDDLEIIENYSGRGMGGETTTAISGIGALQLAELAINFAHELVTVEEGMDFAEAEFDVGDLSTDNLAEETIIY